MNWKSLTGSPEFEPYKAAAKLRITPRRQICEQCPNFRGLSDENVKCGTGKVCCGGKRNEAPLSLAWAECPELRWCKSMFDRCAVISLKRTPDRLQQFKERFGTIKWPFVEPELFEAMDGDKLPTPSGAISEELVKLRQEVTMAIAGIQDQTVKNRITTALMSVPTLQNKWGAGGGAWGCMESHRWILRDCIMRDIDSVFILEDDAEPTPDFMARLPKFLEELPPNWDGIMLGGQHFGTPKDVAPGVVRTNGFVNRTHAYGVRGKLLKELYASWESHFWHCDHAMGRVFDNFNVYCPSPFLIGQGKNQSQIRGVLEPARFWSGNDLKAKMILLHAPRSVTESLRVEGVHFGYSKNEKGIDVGLAKIFESNNSVMKMVGELRSWISMIANEAAAFEQGVGAIWYPTMNPQGLQAVKLAMGKDFLELRINSKDSYLKEREKHALVTASSSRFSAEQS